jgi:hypothetical protein
MAGGPQGSQQLRVVRRKLQPVLIGLFVTDLLNALQVDSSLVGGHDNLIQEIAYHLVAVRRESTTLTS